MIFLRLFKNSRAGGIIGLVILAVALFLISFLERASGINGPGGGLREFTAMPFYDLMFGPLQQKPVWNRIVSIFLLLISTYILIRVSATYGLIEFRSVMPAYFFLLFTAALPSTHQVSPAMLGFIFYLLSFYILFGVSDKKPDTFTVFNAGLVLALGGLFYLKLIWFLPLIWISIWTLRPATGREMLYPVVAFFLLGLFLFAWYWGGMDDAEKFVTLVRENLSFRMEARKVHYSAYLYYGFFLVLIIAASLYMIYRFQARKTVIQNIYQVMFYMFVAGLLFFVLIARFDSTTLIFIAFPVAFILSNYFHRRNNPWTHELALWILFSLLVFMQYSLSLSPSR